MHKSTSGFTIVELLIVVVVIAVLAAISIGAYTGIQNRSYDTSVQNDLRTITKKLDLARVADNTTDYPTNNTTIAAEIPDVRVNKNAYAITPAVSFNLLFCWPNISAPNNYTLLAVSKSGKQYYITSAGKLTEYTGGTAWNSTDPTAICNTVTPGMSGSGAGYSAGDTTTGPWRSWTGQ